MVGKTISHYKILEKLGEGGMGVVYRAKDTRLDRFVALKFLPRHLSQAENEKQRFVHEAKAASALDHNNICTIHEIAETEDSQMFIAMAFYAGETLKNRISRGPLPLEDAIIIAKQTAQGLARAHEADIIHRDIKPENIIITTRGEVKIIDFGLAKLAGQSRLTKTGTTLGTMSYMSPEQLQGKEVDHRTDIWSLGVVLYEMLAGQPPFKGEFEAAVVYSILHETPQPLMELHPDLPVGLEDIVQRTMSENRAERYQSAEELYADLESINRQTEAGTLKPQTSQRQRARSKRKTLSFGAAGLVIVAFLALAVFLFKTPPSDEQKSVAVLPFENLTNKEEDEYFSDGMTEDILIQLSKIADLRVISSVVTRQYKQSEKSPEEIGNELKVRTLLTGSVRRAVDQLRITCQLLDAQTGVQLWAASYDREMKEVFAIQSEVAEEIAERLKASIQLNEVEQIRKKPTENLAAYNFYLKAREHRLTFSRQNNEQAVILFKKAIELDPHFALAWAELSFTYSQWANKFGFGLAWLDSAITASNRAIALDPTLPEGLKSLGFAYAMKGQHTRALAAFQKAKSLDPNYAPPLACYIYGQRGALDQALRCYKEIVARNPTRAFLYAQVGWIYSVLGDDTIAEKWYHDAILLEPNLTYPYGGLAWMYLSQDNERQALLQAEKLLSLDSGNPTVLERIGSVFEYASMDSLAHYYYEQAIAKAVSIETDYSALSPIGLGHLLLKSGQWREAEKLLDLSLQVRLKEIDNLNEANYLPYETAAIYAIRDNKEEAYRWLQKAIDAGWRDYRLGLQDPWFENLRSEERFQQMMNLVKVKVDSIRGRVVKMGW